MGFEIPHRNRGADMRTKNQETLDRILKFVNKYYQEYHSSPTINDVAEGVGVARSTTHRYLQELSDRNLIDYGRDRACSAGGRRLRKSLEGGLSRKSGEENKSLL